MLKLPAPDEAKRLRQFFLESNYTKEGLREVLVVNELTARRLRNLPRLLDRTRERTALHTLMRWFTVGVPVDSATARDVVPHWVLDLCLNSGLLLRQADALVASVMLSPFEDFLVASDHSLRIEAGEDPNVVLVINPTTWLVHRFTVRRPFRATLDLGSGCGALALAASTHSERVVATDLNPRATEFTAFSARLNGCENVECLTGDTFGPVAGRKFDLIVANPPFFITPSARYLFCDNDMDLDLFCRRVIREAQGYLQEGGFLQMVCEWAEIAGQPWRERLTEWVEGTGCDAWILKGHTEQPSKYAQDRIRETTVGSPEADAANYAQWTAYYRERRVEAIHRGLIAIRRREGANWVRIEETPATLKKPFGEAVLQGFETRDFLEAHPSDSDLLDAKLRISPHAQLDRRLQLRDGKWRLASLHLFLLEGIPHSQKLEPLVAEFIGRFDGSRTVGEAVRDLGTLVEANPGEVRGQCLEVARRLIERGFLLCETAGAERRTGNAPSALA